MNNIFLTDRRYDPENINILSKLSSRTGIARFLGEGGESVLAKLSLDEKKDFARQLYLHAELCDVIENTPLFAQTSLVVAEPVFNEEYELESTDKVLFAANDLNKTKKTGETMVYSLVDDWGYANVSQNFELAMFIKDNVKCEEVTLDYDTYDPEGGLNVNVVVTFPKVTKEFNNLKPCSKVKTWFNNNIMSDTDLVELE